MGRRLSSNGTAVGMASLTAASDLMVLGTSPRTAEMDDSRIQQTLHSMSTVLDRIVKENAKKRNRKYNMLKLPSQRNDGDGLKHTVSLTESKSKGGMDDQAEEKITRKGIRARMDDDGEKVDDSFAPPPKRTAGAAEIGMMKQSAKNLVPQLLDLTAALSALPPDVYIQNSGTEASTLLLQARLLVARAVEHVEKLSEIANNKQLQRIPKKMLQESQNGKLKVQLGAAGDSAMLGWLNIDIVGNRAIRTKAGPRPVELSMSIASNPLPLDAETCAFVYAAHTLEHIRFPDDTSFVLNEVYRVLKPGGVVRLVVPDAKQWLEAYVHSNRQIPPSEDPDPFWKAARKNWASWQWMPDDPITGTRLPVTMRYLGAMETDLEMTNPHKTGFDFETLKAALLRSGFDLKSIVHSKFMGSKHKALKVDHISEAAEHYYVDKSGNKKYFSLFVEATKPSAL